MKLGERLKMLRKDRDLTLDRLAQMCGVAKATLSRIENGVTTGNLNTHLKICESLRVNIGELYQGLDDPNERVVAFEGKKIKEAEVFSYDEKVSSILLTKQSGKKQMLPQILMIDALKHTSLEENRPGTDKFVYCLEGEAELKIGEKTYGLEKNDSLYFDASLPHSFKNKGQKTARLLVVVSPVAL